MNFSLRLCQCINSIDTGNAKAEAQAEAESSILEEEVALAGGGEPEGIASAGVIASVLQFSGALAVVAV